MVKTSRVRAPEIPLARFLIFLFTLAVAGAFYYAFGGPIPYFIHYEGPPGAAFEGSYTLSSDVSDASTAGGVAFQASYPHTVTLWGSREQGVVATVQNAADTKVLNTITVRRAGVVCAEAYRWGSGTDAVCSTP